jgi:transposase InsO family protein
MMNDDVRSSERWARLRFAIVGPLLAAPPERGELRGELERLAAKTWQHPTQREPVRFGVSTIERWYYAARAANCDPVRALARRVRRDAGTQPSVSEALRVLVHAQHGDHPGWSFQLHVDNLAVLVAADRAYGVMPSYATVRRYMKSQGLRRKRRPKRATPGARQAEARLVACEVRSYEASHVHGLWHLDFHEGSRKVLTRAGRWVKPKLLGLLDDRSRLACHLQWYLDETAESLVHGLCQAFQKRALPRALMTDNGAAMRAGEVCRGLAALGIVHEKTLPYSPYQNGKQENFWTSVEGRLMAMLEGHPELTLGLLNEATQAWVEGEYNRTLHSEIGVAPLTRLRDDAEVGRESPGSADLRRTFRAEVTRTQRRSDGTVSVLGRRFELPSRFRHIERVRLRYTSWDLTSIDLVDSRTGEHVCVLRPQDKTRNADGERRRHEPAIGSPEASSPEAGSTDLDPDSSGAIAPLLAKLMADYSATGLPPAYLPTHDLVDPEETDR